MIAELGLVALWFAAALAGLQVIAGALELTPHGRNLAGIIRPVAMVQGLLATIAFAALTVLFCQTDLSVKLVAINSHSAKPLFYKFADTWANRAGSILLWLTMMGLAGAFVARASRRLPEPAMLVTLAGQAFVSLGFYAFLLLGSNPFERLTVPATEGLALKPLLQDPVSAFHMPMLYFGYAGLVVGLSFAIGALVTRETGMVFARAMRPWVLGAWVFLTLGITAGSCLASRNSDRGASVVLWLVATALIHHFSVPAVHNRNRSWKVPLHRMPLPAWGRAIAHFGIAVALFGIISDNAFSAQRLVAARIDEVQRLGPWQIRLDRIEPVAGPGWTALEGRISASYNGAAPVILYPQARSFWISPQQTSAAAVATRWNGQLYAVLGEAARDGSWQLRLWWRPFAPMIQLGGMLIALGGLLALSGHLRSDLRRIAAREKIAYRRTRQGR